MPRPDTTRGGRGATDRTGYGTSSDPASDEAGSRAPRRESVVTGRPARAEATRTEPGRADPDWAINRCTSRAASAARSPRAISSRINRSRCMASVE